ncbi:MAG: hypothetical protein ACRCY8_18675 [Dermatophilaceae bacterium]
MTLQVSLDALRDDSRLWDGVSDVLSTSSTACAGLTLTAHELTGVAEREGLVAAYESVRALVERLLREGATNTGDIAERLLDVRRQYEDDDAGARARIGDAWTPA